MALKDSKKSNNNLGIQTQLKDVANKNIFLERKKGKIKDINQKQLDLSKNDNKKRLLSDILKLKNETKKIFKEDAEICTSVQLKIKPKYNPFDR